MTITEARDILGVTRHDNAKTIKLKFRKMMTKYHPDAVGSDAPEHLKRAQLINEAFSILRDTIVEEDENVVKRAVWEAEVVEDAFIERVIYMSDILWEEQITEYVEVTRGKYQWDPDLEEFECLLRSLSMMVMELLENIEQQNGIYKADASYIKEQKFLYQVQLFHLLAGQFIAPVFCLKKLAIPEQTDKLGRNIYKFQAFLGTKGNSTIYRTMSKLNTGDLLYAASLKDNRILVKDTTGTALGHLSLSEDQLYYVIIPILQNHLAQVKFVVREIEVKQISRIHRVRVNVDLYLRMEDNTEVTSPSDQNLRIASVLNQYDSYLKNIG